MTFMTKGAAQRQQILEHLLTYETLTTIEARNMGIMSPAPRVLELRAAGWPIGTNEYDQEDHAGVMHKQGQHYLQKELLTPEQREIQRNVRQDNA